MLGARPWWSTGEDSMFLLGVQSLSGELRSLMLSSAVKKKAVECQAARWLAAGVRPGVRPLELCVVTNPARRGGPGLTACLAGARSPPRAAVTSTRPHREGQAVGHAPSAVAPALRVPGLGSPGPCCSSFLPPWGLLGAVLPSAGAWQEVQVLGSSTPRHTWLCDLGHAASLL